MSVLSVSNVDVPIAFQSTATFNGAVTLNAVLNQTANTSLGNVNISGVTAMTGNLVIGSNSSNSSAKLQVIENNASTLLLGGEIAEFAHNLDSFAQVHLRNASATANASADFVVTADNGTDATNYIDLGINNSTYSQPGIWTINQALDGYLYTSSQNLAIGAANTGKSVSFFTGGTLAANERVRITQGLSVGSTADPGAGSISATGAIRSSGALSGIGYSTGAGGTVTQLTSKTTAVTLNDVCGQITMSNAALASAAEVAFTLNNTAIEANDVIIVNIKSGATLGAYSLTIGAVAAGSCSITLSNISGASLSEAVVLSFAVIKAVIA